MKKLFSISKLTELVEKARRVVKYTFVLVAFIEAVDFFVQRVKKYTGDEGVEEIKGAYNKSDSVDSSVDLVHDKLD